MQKLNPEIQALKEKYKDNPQQMNIATMELYRKYKVNPIAMLLSVKLMFDWLGETEKRDRLENAIAKVIKEGKVRTYDMGGSSSTLEVAEEVARNL
jgi:isocitrate/isopropylmalate dehydrogenase